MILVWMRGAGLRSVVVLVVLLWHRVEKIFDLHAVGCRKW